ncbi:MAG: hypothetical protein H6586_03880 [Flavobacteriales bacterium]|nr:hypothetical protein [Flavobacteriales bacterium]
MNKLIMSAVLLFFVGCSNAENQPVKEHEKTQQQPTHHYGGWYCPDNLFGFPAVNLKDWKNVPVIQDRLPTQEETRNGSSLIFVEILKYPDAKAMNIQLPQLANYYSPYTKKTELVIVIQAIEIENDTIVGFRYLNGGNGSSHYREVDFISENEVANLHDAKFVNLDIPINADEDKVWDVLTDAKVKYQYANKEQLTNGYGDLLFGNWYMQNDYLINDVGYVEKFLVIRDKEKNLTELKIVCGPYLDDFENQQTALKDWSEKVKELSEK